MTPEENHNLSFLKVLPKTTWELWVAVCQPLRCFTKGAYYTHLPQIAQFFRIISRYNSKKLIIFKQKHY